MYQKEAVDQEARIERMKQEGKDEYDIKKQHEVLGESMMMIPDCDKRIKAAYHELKNLLDAQTDAEVLASKEVKEALELLEANVPAT
ncbi:putative tubulin-specific chaperone A-like isoform X2 [Apostichopus japonicus]|uniref:Tubulin-specific chaperone A n=2 Tax=Stichopus japonicus TaxID=307972 RepID=A0A2G8LMB7_STIJA|nr:putative tubulin-specific chaperone A-like isoform X2 [Apostichopus japonicus]